jgi:butyryl-CoA dehydrogenase
LAFVGRAAQLPGELTGLGEAGGTERVAFRDETTGWVDHPGAAVGGVAVVDKLAALTLGTEPPRLLGQRFVDRDGTPDQIDRFVKPILAGRFAGTTCLSEPQAGSSLSDITTRAEQREDSTYRNFGARM